MHGPTFMANALACAAANASLDLFASEPRIETGRSDSSKSWSKAWSPAVAGRACAMCASKGAIGVVEMEDIADLAYVEAALYRAGSLLYGHSAGSSI